MTTEERQHGKWHLLFKRAPSDIDFANLDLTNCIEIIADTPHFYADPFVIRKNDKYYIFFEQLKYVGLIGWLAYFTVDDNDKVEGPFPLEIPIPSNIHCSYPYIFEANGKMYMIPESCHLNCINLYECTEFPGKWQFVKTLIPNAHAGDTSVIYHNGLWYLFTWNLVAGKYQFQIYYSSDILGEWTKHDLIREGGLHPDNEKLTRCGGKIFYHNGKLIRPAWHSNRGINGEAVILYEIKQLDAHTYHEVPINIVEGNQFGQRCVHTFTYNDGAIVMDTRPQRDADFPWQPFTQPKENNTIMDNNYYINHEILKEAFSINTSGNGKCYYGITIDGHHYPGERNWDLRWDLIKDCIDWSDKSVMDIGCNMGITLAYLKKFRNVEVTMGIEATDEFLQKTDKPRTIEALKKLEDAFGLTNNRAHIFQMDLNSPEMANNLESFDIDNADSSKIVVIAMSILKWIDRKDEFIYVLSHVNTVIYEGHESDEEELARFAKYGFTGKILGKTQTGASYPDDDMRTLILFTK